MNDQVLVARADWPRLRVTLRELALLAGFLGLMAAGIYNLAFRQELGLAYLAAGLVGGAFIHRRHLPAGIWVAVALWALLWSGQGQLSWLLLFAAAVAGAVVSLLPVTVVWPEAPASVAQPAPAVQPPTVLAEPAAPTFEGAAVLPRPTTERAPEAAPVRLLEREPVAVAEEADLVINLIGRFQVLAGDGSDLTQTILRKKVLCLLWATTLVAGLTPGGEEVPRHSLAGLTKAGLEPKDQTSAFHGQLYDLKKDLPAPIGSRIRGAQDSVAFDLQGCAVDVLRLRQLTKEVRASGRLLAPDLALRVEAFMSGLGQGEFFPGWEEVDRRGRGAKRRDAPTDQVLALRSETERLRAELAAALGITHQAQGHHREALRWLNEALHRNGLESELAERIVEIHMQLGEVEQARSFRARYEKGEV